VAHTVFVIGLSFGRDGPGSTMNDENRRIFHRNILAAAGWMHSSKMPVAAHGAIYGMWL
jgi:hypothetical protein